MTGGPGNFFVTWTEKGDDGPSWHPVVPGRHVRYLGADLAAYAAGERRWDHRAEICRRGGYRELADDPGARFALTRWLYALCWTDTGRPGVLFVRATA